MIDILLATYNGAKYLPQQLDSIITQTYSELRVLIHDDGSSDATVDVIKAYQRSAPEKIVLIDDGIRSLGAKNNFAHLLTISSAEYVMFCDQDDVWIEDKIEKAIYTMRAEEARLGKPGPIGIFSDVRIVDDLGAEIASSGWAHLRAGSWLAESVKSLAVRNCVIGCTLMINRQAKSVSLPIPPEAVMHDWWIGLRILKNGGHLAAIQEPTVLYRQHGRNAVGARKFSVADRALAARNVPGFIRSQEQVFQMARRSGAITNRSSFVLAKTNVLLKSLFKRP